jgi:hypothetical protein
LNNKLFVLNNANIALKMLFFERNVLRLLTGVFAEPIFACETINLNLNAAGGELKPQSEATS